MLANCANQLIGALCKIVREARETFWGNAICGQQGPELLLALIIVESKDHIHERCFRCVEEVVDISAELADISDALVALGPCLLELGFVRFYRLLGLGLLGQDISGDLVKAGDYIICQVVKIWSDLP